MSNCSNFIDLAAAQCGVDVGFGKVILLYADKKTVPIADLTATAINAGIVSGEIVGVLKNWHTIAGAPVAEINVERAGSAEMKLIRPEILADVLTFEGNIGNRDVIDSLVKAGTIYGILVDDLGNAFGNLSKTINCIDTMALNFSGKTSTSLQRDNSSDKTVAVTVRYLVKDLAMIGASIEVEDVASKIKADGKLVLGTVTSAAAATLNLKLIDKYTQMPVDLDPLTVDVTVRTDTENVVATPLTYTNGIFTFDLAGTAFSLTSQNFYVKISGDDFYMKETKFTVTP